MGIPRWKGQAADSDDGGILVRLREELQPAGIRYRVIVEEGHDVRFVQEDMGRRPAAGNEVEDAIGWRAHSPPASREHALHA